MKPRQRKLMCKFNTEIESRAMNTASTED